MKQLTSVDVKKLVSRELDMDTVNFKLAPHFSMMFSILLDVMAVEESKKRIKRETARRQSQSQTSATSTDSIQKKRLPRSPTQPESSKRTRTGESSTKETETAKTPDRPIFPLDPNFTSSTTGSGATDESKDEENTKMLMNTFLINSMIVLGDAFLDIIWARGGIPIELVHSYSSFGLD